MQRFTYRKIKTICILEDTGNEYTLGVEGAFFTYNKVQEDIKVLWTEKILQ